MKCVCVVIEHYFHSHIYVPYFAYMYMSYIKMHQVIIIFCFRENKIIVT
jgi:hypothetical protein